MIDSPTPVVLSEPTDLLASNAATWVRGFSLVPAAPRITALVLDGYRELLELSRYLGNADEERRILARIADLEEGRP